MTQPASAGPLRGGEVAAALLACAALTVASTWPQAAFSTTHVPWGDGSQDAFQFIWNLWWVGHALFERGQSPLFTDLLHHPSGTQLLYHTLTPANGVLAWPVMQIVPGTGGRVLAFHAMVLLSGTLLGGGTYTWLRLLGAGRLAAAAGAAFVLVTPFRVHHAHHLNLLSYHWLPWMLAAGTSGLRTGRASWGYGVGALLALQVWSDLELGVQGLLVAGVVWLAALRPPAQRRTALALGGRAALAAGALLLPLAAAVVALPPSAVSTRGGDGQALLYSANLVGLVSPEPISWLHQWWAPDRAFRGHGVASGEAFLGMAWVVLAAVSAVLQPRSRRWLALGGGLLLLALGPGLHVGPFTLLEQWMPFDLLQRAIPPLGLSRTPVRFVAAASVLLSVGVAGAVTAARTRGRAWTIGVGLLALVLVAERWPAHGIALQPVPVPPAIQSLADLPRGGAVLTLPHRLPHQNLHMFWQTVHGHPITSGYTARVDPTTLAFLDAFEHADATERRALLREAGIRVVVQHPADPEALLTTEPQVHLLTD